MITLDSNVYISALQFGGKPMDLLERAVDGDLDVAVSRAILEEVGRTLREKFGWSSDAWAEARAMILSCATVVEPQQTVSVIAEDPGDDRILECAIDSGSNVIVTGDKDLLRRGEYQGIAIVTVASFLGRAVGS